MLCKLRNINKCNFDLLFYVFKISLFLKYLHVEQILLSKASFWFGVQHFYSVQLNHPTIYMLRQNI